MACSLADIRRKCHQDPFCKVCYKKDGLLRCKNCKFIYYCGKKCQRKDWKEHKKVCEVYKAGNECGENESIEEIISKIDPEIMANFMSVDYADMAYAPKIPEYHKEYKNSFPTDISGYNILRDSWMSDRRSHLISGCNNNEPQSKQHFLQRWGWCLQIEEVRSQLNNGSLRPGDILKDIVLNKVEDFEYPYQVNQTMKNTPVRPQEFQLGQTYVAIGFVDLSPLLMGSYKSDAGGTIMPMKYISQSTQVYFLNLFFILP